MDNQASVFDPKTFAQMSFQGVADTQSYPIPQGEHPSTITNVEIKGWQSQDGSKAGLKAEFTLTPDDSDGSISKETGRPKERNTLRYEVMLDLTPTGGLDLGKGMNVRLGKLQEAVGFKEGQPWAWDSFKGRRCVPKVVHAPYKDTKVANVDSVRAE